MIAIAVAALTGLLFAFTPLVEVWAVHRVNSVGGTGPGSVLAFADASTSIALLLTQLTAVICLMVWLYAAYDNLSVFADARPQYSAGLAVGSWFIPLLHVIFPWLVLTDLVRCSTPPARQATGARLHRLVWLWAAAYGLAWIGLVYCFVVIDRTDTGALDTAVARGETVDAGLAGYLLTHQVAAALLSAVLWLATGVCALLVIHRITALQYDRFDAARQPAAEPTAARQPTAEPTAGWTTGAGATISR